MKKMISFDDVNIFESSLSQTLQIDKKYSIITEIFRVNYTNSANSTYGEASY